VGDAARWPKGDAQLFLFGKECVPTLDAEPASHAFNVADAARSSYAFDFQLAFQEREGVLKQ